MAALHLAYLAIDLVPGDEVLVAAQTHVATAHAVEICGATPVFVDCDSLTGNVDLDDLESRITDRTRAIGIVHYLGLPLDLDRLMTIATRHGLYVVEDCAIALGATHRGTHVGLIGDVGTFSFYPVKHITTGEGGMVITRRSDIAERISRQRAFGIDRNVVADRRHTGEYDVVDVGLNYRLSEIGAAIGIVQMDRLPGFLETRARNFRRLAAGLEGLEGIYQIKSDDDGERKASHYCLSVVLDKPLATRRSEIIDELKGRGIGTSVYYPKALPDLAYYAEKYGYKRGSCPNASLISDASIAFPVAPHVSEDDVDYMIEVAREVLQ
jgi:perosamine synthetase